MSPACRWALTVTAVLLVVTAAIAQQVGSVTPNLSSGSAGANQMFTFTATYPYGSSPELDMAITNDPNGGANGCYFVWQESGTLSLYDDSSGNWYSVQLGSASTASNAHCQINGQSSWYFDDGWGDVSLSLSVSFFSTWAGATLEFFGQAVDDYSGSSSGWWQIPESQFLVLGPSQGLPSFGAVTANGTTSFTSIGLSGRRQCLFLCVLPVPQHSVPV